MLSSAGHSAAAPRHGDRCVGRELPRLDGADARVGLPDGEVDQHVRVERVTTSTMRARSDGSIRWNSARAQPPTRRVGVDAEQPADPRLGLEQRRDERAELAAHPADEHTLPRHRVSLATGALDGSDGARGRSFVMLVSRRRRRPPMFHCTVSGRKHPLNTTDPLREPRRRRLLHVQRRCAVMLTASIAAGSFAGVAVVASAGAEVPRTPAKIACAKTYAVVGR